MNDKVADTENEPTILARLEVCEAILQATFPQYFDEVTDDAAQEADTETTESAGERPSETEKEAGAKTPVEDS